MTTPAAQPRAIVCTGNAHKVAELGGLLPDLALEPLPAGFVLPPEVGSTFLDNARIKAHAGHAWFPDAWVIADDSGLCVDALGGLPGVRSARLAGPAADDEANVAELLRRMVDVPAPRRSAHFECVLVAIGPSGDEAVARGQVAGTILEQPRGSAGFGYDPLFVPEGEQRSFAELGDEAKARLSHRARAARALRELLAAMA